MLASLAVDVVDLAGLDVAKTVLLVEQNGGQNEFLLAWEGGDDRRHLVGFDLALGDADMVLVHRIITGLFSLFR